MKKTKNSNLLKKTQTRNSDSKASQMRDSNYTQIKLKLYSNIKTKNTPENSRDDSRDSRKTQDNVNNIWLESVLSLV